MTKIDIFSGFLGAGKTTLIRKLLREAYRDEKLVLIENEFGQIGIDGGFLREAGIEITEMNSGCICCSLVGDFRTALSRVIDRFHPDRILIEPSGVGKLSDVIRAVQGADTAGAELGGFTTVVDAKKAKMYMKNFGEFFNDQVSNAGCIVLSHTQEMSEDKIAACVAMLREKNPTAVIVTTPWEELDGARLRTAMERTDTIEQELIRLRESTEAEHEHEHHHHHHGGDECDDPNCCCHHHDDDDEHEHEHHHHHHDGDECDDPDCCCHHHDDDDEHAHEHEHHHHHHDGDECDDPDCCCHHHHDDDDEHEHEHEHHHHHHADDVFSSWGAETPKKFTEAIIRTALETMEEQPDRYGTILRAKGIVADEDGSWLHFDYIPGEIDIRHGSADVTGRLCVIGSHLNRSEIAALFEV